MNNEFYEHKKSDAVKWIIVFVLIGVLFAGMIASLVMSAPDKIEETEGGVNVGAAAGDFEATIMHNTEFISLKMSAQAVTAADNSVSKTLTATVTPDDANDKSVDWSIAWMSGATRAEEAVTDYVTVTPESDGALVATVTCHKAFPGDKAVITVKTTLIQQHMRISPIPLGAFSLSRSGVVARRILTLTLIMCSVLSERNITTLTSRLRRTAALKSMSRPTTLRAPIPGATRKFTS